MTTETLERPLAEGERQTETADRKRTTAATEARQRKAAAKKAVDVALAVDLLDDETLGSITELFMVSLVSRGYRLPDVGDIPTRLNAP